MDDSPGVEIGNETNTVVSAEETIRPIRDVIICEVLEWQPSRTIKVIYQGRPLRGKVLAIGPGHHPWRYNGRKGVRTERWESKAFLPTDCKVGDEIELGGLERRGYLFGTFRWGTKTCVMCREADVATVTSAEQEQQASPRSSVAIA